MSTIWYVIFLIFVLTFNQTLIALYEATVSLSFILPHTKAEVIQTSQEKTLATRQNSLGFIAKLQACLYGCGMIFITYLVPSYK